jgi:hypothetical protein
MPELVVAWWLATAPVDYSKLFELQSKVYYSPKKFAK